MLLPERAGEAKCSTACAMSRGEDVDPQRGALAVVLLELVGLDPVGGGALLAPRRVPDPRALEDGVGVDRVDADPGAAALLGEAAREVQLGGLGRRVGRGVLARHQRVLGRDEHERAADVLLAQDPERLARDEEVAGDEDVVVAVPLVERRVLERRARRDAGVGDEDVDAAVAVDGLGERGRHRLLAGDVAADRQPVVAVGLDRVRRALLVEVERDHARAGARRARRRSRGRCRPRRR